MPTVLRVGPFRFFFYAGDRDEPPHVHVERDDNQANGKMEELIEQNQEGLMESWDEFFNE